MLRRLVAGLGALALVVEAAVLVVVHLVLGRATAAQSMSVAGSDPDVMSKATYGLGIAMGAFLLLNAVLLAVAALRDRRPGRAARAVLVAAAVTHGVLGALAAALVGWGAFAAVMAVFCLIMAALTLHAEAGDGDGAREGLRPTNP
ncbi:hypothetical protein GCM10010302_50690 [Streptomyces polychromogenes]|uniref:Integral membrane protein n=1 Tax=Streptomyces polychromogenes TaxID=67342 RepID=A0ABP3F5T1_9ACTN